MKKLKIIAAILLSALCVFAQNPTQVRPQGGITNATPNFTGIVKPTLYTGSVNTAVQQLYGHDASGLYRWYDASAFGGSPGGASGDIQFNNAGVFGGSNAFKVSWPTPGFTRISNGVGGIEIVSSGGHTNAAPVFYGKWPGAIDLGDTALTYSLSRETTGIGWAVGLTPNANIRFILGGSTGVRGSASTGGTIGNQDGQTIYAEDASAGNINHILPAVNQNNTKIFKFYKNDNTENEVHICTQGGTLMSNGATNYVLYAPGDSVTVWNNAGNTWDVLDAQSYPKFFSWFHKDSTVITGNAITMGVLATQLNDEQSFQNAAASNDVFRVKAYLARGTNYHLRALGTTDTSRGIQRWQITDGAGTRTIDSMDWYNAVNQLNVQKTSAAFSVLQPGYVVITSTVTNKNASATDFVIALTRVTISEP